MPSPSDEPIRDAIDAESGRFEYFKHALILGAAGIAGLAAILTDETKVPETPLRKWLLGACGVIFLLLIVTAVFGISGATRAARRTPIAHAVTAAMLAGGAVLFVYVMVLLTAAPAAKKPEDAALLAMIADAKRTAEDAAKTADDAKKAADDAASAAARNSTALAAFSADLQSRFSATEALIRKVADDGQTRFDAIDRRFLVLEQMVGNIKPPPPPMPLSLEQAKDIQRALQTRGFRPGPIDGVFGPKTGAAIRA